MTLWPSLVGRRVTQAADSMAAEAGPAATCAELLARHPAAWASAVEHPFLQASHQTECRILILQQGLPLSSLEVPLRLAVDALLLAPLARLWPLQC